MIRFAAGALLSCLALGGCGDSSNSSQEVPPKKTDGQPKAKQPDVLDVACRAFVAERAADPDETALLARTARRAVEEMGLTEKQLEQVGARPDEVAGRIIAAGRPEVCGPLLEYVQSKR